MSPALQVDSLPLEAPGKLTGKELRVINNSSNKNEVVKPKQEQCSDVDVSDGES